MACHRAGPAAVAGRLPAEPPPLVPRKILFGHPERVNPQVSPDGKRLAYLAPDDDDVLQVWVRTLGKKDNRKVTADEKRGVHVFLWTYAPDTLLYLQDQGGDENYHIHSVNLASHAIRDLTPFVGVRADLMRPHRDFPNELLATLNQRDRRYFDVYRINLKTGAIVLDTKNPGDVVVWEPDPKYRIRAAVAVTPDGGREVRLRDSDKAPWKTLFKWDVKDVDSRLLDFTADGSGLWMTSSTGRNTRALVRRDLKTGKETVVASDDAADVGGVFYDFGKHRPQIITFTRARSTIRVLDPDVAADVAFLKKQARGELSVVSRDQALNTWVVAFTEDVKPTHYYVYERPKKKLSYLFSAQPELEKYKLAPVKPVILKSRDGLELVCYMTLPVGIPAKKLPLVLNVHGGPWAAGRMGLSAADAVAGQPRLCRPVRQLPRLGRFRQEVPARRRPPVGAPRSTTT